MTAKTTRDAIVEKADDLFYRQDDEASSFAEIAEAVAEAPRMVAPHDAWTRRGLDEGVFLAVGSLQGNAGGASLAHGTRLAERAVEDPFDAEDGVRPEIHQVAPARTDPHPVLRATA